MTTNETSGDVYAELLQRTGEANPRPRMEPVRKLAQYLGDPQLEFEIIHVAGTNGKTSTARAIETILRSHGIKTGLFTSPHLIDFTERIKIDGENISAEALSDAWQEMQPALQIIDAELVSAGQSKITFFEALAVLAFVAFADAPVEVAIIEVGMGGEWDATNIVDSRVSVFTPISFDHTHILGTDLSQIAATKAGIIKPDTVVVSGKQESAVSDILRAKSQDQNSDYYELEKDFSITKDIPAVLGRMFDARGLTAHEYEGVLLPLFGRHQSENTLLAIAAVEAYFGLTREIDSEVLNEAFAAFSSPGRLHAISNNSLILVDSAHNPHGVKSLITALSEHFIWDELLLVVGVLDDKNVSEMLGELLPVANKVFAVTIDSDRSLTAEQVANQVQSQNENLPIDSFDSVAEALNEAHSWGLENSGRLTLVAGSVLLAGEAIEFSNKKEWGS